MMKLVVTVLMFVSLSVDASVLTVWGYAPESRKTYRDGMMNAFWTNTLPFPASDEIACKRALDSLQKKSRLDVAGCTCFDDGGNEYWNGDEKR